MRLNTILAWFGGLWLFGIGVKFLIGYFLDYSMPFIPVLDVFMDWAPATILGAALIVTALKTVYQDGRGGFALKTAQAAEMRTQTGPPGLDIPPLEMEVERGL